MDTSETQSARPDEVAKTSTDALPPPSSSTAPAASEVIDHNTQSSTANSNLKDLSLNSFTETSTSVPTGAATEATPSSSTTATNGVNGVNGVEATSQVAQDTAASADAKAVTPADDGDTVMTIEYGDNQAEPVADPVVQQPTSDVRGPTEPITSEQEVKDLKEAKQISDLASDQELASGIAESATAPIKRSLTPVVPASSGDAMELTSTSNATADTAASDLSIPHHPSVPAVEGVAAPAEDPVEPAPTPKDTEAKPSPAPGLAPPQSQDAVMTDVPPSPGKVARSRDEDESDEPATKRHKTDDDSTTQTKTEPAQSEPAATASAPAAAPAPPAQASTASQTPGTLPESLRNVAGAKSSRVPNPDYDKPMTEPQRKQVDRVLALMKRHKVAAAFRNPVDTIALNIPTYYNFVKKPMDIKTIDDKFKKSEYQTANQIWDDLDQIVQNSIIFNGLEHGVTIQAYALRHTFDTNMAKVPSADYVEPAPASKKKRVSTDKPPPKRRESRSSIGNAKSPVAGSPTQTFALNPATGVPHIRRESTTVTDGRPRREIHPPAPKDLPYSNQRPRKKKYAWEIKWCEDVVKELKKSKYAAINFAFLVPVDPVALNIPSYHKIIKKPMDISTMETKLKTGEYENAKDFDADMRLMFQNCYKFNPEGDPINKAGHNLEAIYQDRVDSRSEWIKERAPPTPQDLSSPEGSDEEEEEESEDEESEEDVAARQISDLQKQLEALQQAVAKKKKTPPVKGKKSGGKKGAGAAGTGAASSSKPSKKEAAAPAKKVKGASKKEGKAKKPAKTRYVTYEEKQDISARINNLPENRMAQALNIIRDNMPGLKGVQDDEIELDIDELSNDVLLKLLGFVRKYAPLPDDESPAPRAAAPPPPAAPSKPKKAKPMGKVEQERRIAELKNTLNGRGAAAAAAAAGSPDSDEGDGGAESSGDEDSEEESEED